jgi:hypothetical protein
MPFPFFRASVDEGIGLACEGNFEYHCNHCNKDIESNRLHALNKNDYDLCEECFVKLKKNIPEISFSKTQGLETNAEYLESDKLAKNIISDYLNNTKYAHKDFNYFLEICNLQFYSSKLVINFYSYLRKFNSYTLYLFTQSKFYIKKYNESLYNKNIKLNESYKIYNREYIFF